MNTVKLYAEAYWDSLDKASSRAWLLAVIMLIIGYIGGSVTVGALLAFPLLLVSLICEAIEKHKPTVIIHTNKFEDHRNDRPC